MPVVTQSASAASSQGGATNAWANPTNALVSDGAYATLLCTTNAANQDFLAITNFGFALPSDALVTGVEVIYRQRAASGAINGGGSTTQGPESIYLTKDGSTNAGSNLGQTGSSGSNSSVITTTIGSPTNLWGTTLSAADINASTFGMRMRNKTVFGSATWQIDRVQIRVTYQTGELTYTNTNSSAQAYYVDGLVSTTTSSALFWAFP